MTAREIKIGGRYHVKVSGRIVPVEVVSTFEYSVRNGSGYAGVAGRSYRDGWNCRNIATGRMIKVRSPQKFRGEVPATA